MHYHRLNSIIKVEVLIHYIDLAIGYWQAGMLPDSKEKTALMDCIDLVIPFDLCNVPVTFQRLKEVTLRGLAQSKCITYLDDILVMGCSFRST